MLVKKGALRRLCLIKIKLIQDCNPSILDNGAMLAFRVYLELLAYLGLALQLRL